MEFLSSLCRVGGDDKDLSEYTGLILTAIEVTETDTTKVESNEKEYKCVKFSKLDKVGKQACFLKDVKETNGSYVGTKIPYQDVEWFIRNPEKPPSILDSVYTDEEWKEKFQDSDPIFCVHGIENQPGDLLDMMERRNEFKGQGKIIQQIFADNGGARSRYYPIPVLWPCADGNFLTRRYRTNRDTYAKIAGEAFQKMADEIPHTTFRRKALMCHSMGNHLLVHGACAGKEPPDVHFDDIFFVSADLDHNIFLDNVDDDWLHKAGNCAKLLNTDYKDGERSGEFHVLHNSRDLALIVSPVANLLSSRRRLGLRGSPLNNKLRSEFASHLKNIDCNGRDNYDSRINHSYQFEEYCIQYYLDPTERRTKNPDGNASEASYTIK